MHPSPRQPHQPARRGFTLVELMLSIAIVLLLMIGINAIFKTTADTIGTGQSAIAAARDLRNVFDTLDNDFGGFLDPSAQPVITIYNQNLPGFRDKIDMSAAKDYLATNSYENALHQYDAQGNLLPSLRLDGINGTGAPVLMDNRNHRVDILTFFSSGRYRRQTGLQNDGGASFQSLYGSDTAYIWYGHVRQPTNSNVQTPGGFLQPGMTNLQNSGNNPNGFFANQWVLGRMAILLGSPNAGVINASNASGGTVAQAYLKPGTATNTLIPLAYGTQDTFDGTAILAAPNSIQDSVCDVAGISLSDFTTRVLVQAKPATPPPTGGTTPQAWAKPLLTNGTSINNIFRFACKPWATRPASQLDMALSAPALIRGCSQFTVEFAGDYVVQGVDPNSTVSGVPKDQITAQGSDGVLDFDIVVPTTGNATPQKRVRWYGLERRYPGNTSANPGDRYYLDVRPVVSWVKKDLNANAQPLPFEKVSAADAVPSSVLPVPLTSYTCAWSPYDLQYPNLKAVSDPNLTATVLGVSSAPIAMKTAYPNGFMPWMIRLTIRVDDPNGRLQDGQTLQYIFNLPHK